MPNNLTISIGADTAKLRADLALAQAQLKQFGTDLRNASQQALKTGDTTGVAAIAADFEKARAGVAALGKELSLARGHVVETKSAFSELKAAAGEAVAKPLEAFEKLASLEIPDLALLLGPAAVAAAGAGAALGYLAKEAAESVRALQNEAATLGITTEAFEGLKFAASTVGITQDQLLVGINRFTADIGRARQEQVALDAKAEAHTEKLAETQRQLNAAIESTRLAASRAALATKEAAQAIIDADRSLDAANRSVRKAQQALDDFKTPPDQATLQKRRKEELEQGLKDALAVRQKALEDTRKVREKARQDAEQLVIEQKKLHDEQLAIEKAHQKAMLDAAAQGADKVNQRQGLSEGLRDVASGSPPSANVLDQLKEYADKLKAVGTATAQANMAREDFGRGFAAFLPLLRQGSEGLERLTKASEEFTVTATPAEEAMSASFTVAWTKLSTVLEGLKTAIGNIVGQLITPQLTALAEWLSENRETIRAWAQGFVDAIHMIGAAFSALGDVVNTSPFGLAFKSITGGDLTAGLEKFTALWAGLSIAAAAAMTTFSLVAAVVAPLGAIFGTIGAAIGTVVTWLTNFTELMGVIAVGVGWPAILLAGLVALGAVLLTQGDAWKNFQLTIGALWTLMQAFAGWAGRGFVAVWDTVAGAVKSAFDTIIYWIQYAFGLAENQLNKLKDVASAIGKVFGGGDNKPAAAPSTETVVVPPAVDGKAGGGMIRGPGTGTSDDVLMYGSNGEYVATAEATRKNLPWLQMMNAGLDLSEHLRQLRAGVRNFAEGGLIGRLVGPIPQMIPRYAGGGIVDGGFADRAFSSVGLGGPLTPVNITIGGWVHSLWGERSQIDALTRRANEERMLSAGRPPSWVGGTVAG